MSTVTISEVGDLDDARLARLFGRSSWGREEDYQEGVWSAAMLGSAAIVVTAVDEDGRLLGYARALTDHRTVTWIAEILVDPDHRGKGIGSRLMNEILVRSSHTAIYAQVFVGTEGFFEKFGVTAKSRLVACSRKPAPYPPTG